MKMTVQNTLLGLTALTLATSGCYVGPYDDVTVEHPSLVDLAGDDFEKDIATGDFDRDGDMDIIVARKFFIMAGSDAENTDPGNSAPPVLLMNEGGTLANRTANRLAPEPLKSLAMTARDVWVGDLTVMMMG